MEFCHVRLEAHHRGATIYVVGMLADVAATRAENLIANLSGDLSVIRVDLRGVQIIDPSAFIRVARSLRHWRDLRRGRVTIEVPERSLRSNAVYPTVAKPRLVQRVFCDGDSYLNHDRYIRAV